MYHRHREVPTYDDRPGRVDAARYNHVQIALRRLGPSIRMELPRLKHLDLILQADAWIIIDRALHDLPMVAWADFETAGRSSLHEPIPCRIFQYSAYAGLVMNRSLEAMELLLGERLTEAEIDAEGRVIPFHPR